MIDKLKDDQSGMLTIEATIVFSAVLLCVVALIWMTTMMFKLVNAKAGVIKAATSQTTQIEPVTFINNVDLAVETLLKRGR